MYTSLSDQIKQCRTGAAANPYQGNDKKVLFVCSMGILRSATAARMYAKKYNTRSCGTWVDEALIPITPLLIQWADEIVFVNQSNFDNVVSDPVGAELLEGKNIKVLNIPDKYEHMHPELIKAFEEQYEPL